MYELQQSSSGSVLTFLMVLTSDHVSPATGLTPGVTLCKNGASFGSPSSTLSEIGSGWYKLDGTGLVTDTNTLGPLILHATGSGADPTDDRYFVVAYDPRNSTNLGLGAIPNVSTGTAGAILTAGTGTAQINPSGGNILVQTGTSAGQFDMTSGIVKSNLTQVTGLAVSQSVAHFGVNLVNSKGTALSGTAGYVGIDLGSVANPTSTLSLTNTTIGTVSSVSLLAPSSIRNTSWEMSTLTGVATGMNDMIQQNHRRFFKKVYKDANYIYTYANDGTTVITQQAYTSSSTETVDAA